ncbi:serine/threonine-protein kinase pim-1-like [Amphiprion ocellaris]|uniref:non-specific serine/threonine protein kinase n=1 Tax=Amphiprion ocellaris TaxID=80972 RepID=A0AAQ6AM00_AMPOC|nr:serine/threonine-protein kinase pim-1-like [Amphiprion ocellaris]
MTREVQECKTKGTKRKASPDHESRKRTKTDQESASSSAGTGRGRLEVGCCFASQSSSTSLGDLKMSRKRKAAADEEGPRAKRRKCSPALKVIREEAEDEPEDSADSRRAAFEAKYEQQDQFSAGGCGAVFAGYRKVDNLPVAIKRVQKDRIPYKQKDQSGKWVSVEVVVMQKLGCGSPGSVSLLDWYDLQQEIILVLERPIPAHDLHTHIEANGGCLEEQEVKIIMKQLVDAAIHLQSQGIFHRDIKTENVLIETGSDVPRARLIDFGLSCFFKRRSSYRAFCGTRDHIPPEWYNHSRYSPGPTTVWQLGVVMFESLHRTQFETQIFLKEGLTINGSLSKNCSNFLKMCLAELPQDRPTLEELKQHPWLR